MPSFLKRTAILFIPFLSVIGALATPAIGSPTCMTQEEARKAFPRDHIYWHGKDHCWDNVKKRSKPAADANAAESPAPSENLSEQAKPSEPAIEKPSKSAAVAPSEPVEPSKRVIVPPVSFIGNDMRHGLAWPVLDAPSEETLADAQQDDPSASEPKEDVVMIGAPNAAPGSSEYLLEHCCWPPNSLNKANEPAPLPHMILASTSACAVAIGLWLFIHRRRQHIWISEPNVRVRKRRPRERRMARHAASFPSAPRPGQSALGRWGRS